MHNFKKNIIISLINNIKQNLLFYYLLSFIIVRFDLFDSNHSFLTNNKSAIPFFLFFLINVMQIKRKVYFIKSLKYFIKFKLNLNFIKYFNLIVFFFIINAIFLNIRYYETYIKEMYSFNLSLVFYIITLSITPLFFTKSIYKCNVYFIFFLSIYNLFEKTIAKKYLHYLTTHLIVNLVFVILFIGNFEFLFKCKNNLQLNTKLFMTNGLFFCFNSYNLLNKNDLVLVLNFFKKNLIQESFLQGCFQKKHSFNIFFDESFVTFLINSSFWLEFKVNNNLLQLTIITCFLIVFYVLSVKQSSLFKVI